MTYSTDTYFDAKARQVFRDAAGDPAVAGELAAWAREAHERAKADPSVTRTGVIVAEDGTVLAETRLYGWDPAIRYVDRVMSAAHREAECIEAGFGAAILRRMTGQQTIDVYFHDVCRGAVTWNKEGPVWTDDGRSGD